MQDGGLGIRFISAGWKVSDYWWPTNEYGTCRVYRSLHVGKWYSVGVLWECRAIIDALV
jgi:hypothetical protein